MPMIPRRGLLGSAALSLIGVVMGTAPAQGSADDGAVGGSNGAGVGTGGGLQPASERGLEQIADAIAQLRVEVRTQHEFTELVAIREAQKQFLRANAKLPDFIEVGSDLWFAVHDWHVRWQQPLTLGRDGLGRYTVLLNPTTVIMRSDTVANFISQPYDNK
jgi:hypothetical protein